MLAQLIFELKLAPQQAARIVRHALQQLLHRLLVFVLLGVALARAKADRLLFFRFALLLRQFLAHFLAIVLLGLLRLGRLLAIRLRIGLVFGTALLRRFSLLLRIALLIRLRLLRIVLLLIAGRA